MRQGHGTGGEERPTGIHVGALGGHGVQRLPVVVLQLRNPRLQNGILRLDERKVCIRVCKESGDLLVLGMPALQLCNGNCDLGGGRRSRGRRAQIDTGALTLVMATPLGWLTHERTARGHG